MAEQLEIPNNEFDQWFDSASKSNDENGRISDHYAELVHRVFAQTEAGQELLEIWAEAIIMIPVANVNSTQIEVGIQEGQNRIVRNIINTCKRVEAETNQ